jgi:hypothetical protein
MSAVFTDGVRQSAKYTYYVCSILIDGRATGMFLIALYEKVKPFNMQGYLGERASGGYKIVYDTVQAIQNSDAGNLARILVNIPSDQLL